MILKELIYLDTSFLHSFIAQSNGGLPQTTQVEKQEQVTESSQKSTGFSARNFTELEGDTGSIGIPGILKAPSGKMRVRLQPGKNSSETISLTDLESGKEIISKQLHDNALELFEEYLSSGEGLYDLSASDLEGKYVKLTSEFKLIDFVYLNKIIQKDTLLYFMYEQRATEIAATKELLKGMPNGEEKKLQREEINRQQKQFEQEKTLMEQQFDDLEKALNYLMALLPNESFLLMENALAPLKKNYLRESANELMFKYGGVESKIKVTMLGKVTQNLQSITMPTFAQDPFSEFPDFVTNLLGSLGIVKEGDKIISPVAIYFE